MIIHNSISQWLMHWMSNIFTIKIVGVIFIIFGVSTIVCAKSSQQKIISEDTPKAKYSWWYRYELENVSGSSYVPSLWIGGAVCVAIGFLILSV